MDDFDFKTMERTPSPPRRDSGNFTNDFATMKDARERRKEGRFAVGDLILNRYKILAELGQGGMEVVYRCLDDTSGTEAALKTVPPELSHSACEMEEVKENFRLVAKLVHQNIAVSKNLEKDDSDGNYYLIMEYVQGKDLRHWKERFRFVRWKARKMLLLPNGRFSSYCYTNSIK